MRADDFIQEISKFEDPLIAGHSKRFFKTGEGQYGEGDVFIGIRVPQMRKICRTFQELPLSEVQKLLNSNIHEHRLAAAIILSEQFKKADSQKKRDIFNFYLKNVADKRINNWDIVDSSAHKIVGPYLIDSKKDILYKLAGSKNLWERRVSMLATFYFIKKGQFVDTLDIAERLLHDKHDLIHKVSGWMLREVGNQPYGREVLLEFLEKHAWEMPRTMLRYSIEKLPSNQRSRYMNLSFSSPGKSKQL